MFQMNSSCPGTFTEHLWDRKRTAQAPLATPSLGTECSAPSSWTEDRSPLRGSPLTGTSSPWLLTQSVALITRRVAVPEAGPLPPAGSAADGCPCSLSPVPQPAQVWCVPG